MKVLLINGSARRQGNTFLALTEAAKTLEAQGIHTEIIQIGTSPVRGCVACCKCKDNGNNRCAFDDDLCNRVAEKMADADALIIGSPVYYGQPNGTLLSLVQRLCYSAGALLRGKPVAAVAVCRRGGATAALQTMLMPFQILSMPIVTSQYWNIVYGRTEGEASLDKEGMQTMRTLALNMSRLLHAAASLPGPQYETPTPMPFIR